MSSNPSTFAMALRLAAETILENPSTVDLFPERSLKAIERTLLEGELIRTRAAPPESWLYFLTGNSPEKYLFKILKATKAEECSRVEAARLELEAAERLAAERAARVDQVYLIRERCSKRCKIGHSIDVADRLRDLQSGSSRRLYVAAAIPGGEEVERQLHDRFAQDRKLGEWFTISPAIEAAFGLASAATGGAHSETAAAQAVTPLQGTPPVNFPAANAVILPSTCGTPSEQCTPSPNSTPTPG